MFYRVVVDVFDVMLEIDLLTDQVLSARVAIYTASRGVAKSPPPGGRLYMQ